MPDTYQRGAWAGVAGPTSPPNVSQISTTLSPYTMTGVSVTPPSDAYVRADASLRVAMSLLSIVLVVLIIVSNTALAMFMRNIRSRRSNGTSLYISAIVATAMIAAFIGLPLNAIDRGLETTNPYVKFFSYVLLFLTGGLTCNYITAFAFHRYMMITRRTNMSYSYTKQKNLLVVVTVYVLVCDVPLTYDIYRNFLEKGLADRTPPTITIGLAAMWIFSCNIAIFVVTCVASKHVQKHNVQISKRISVSQPRLKRIKSIQVIWVVFFILWVPFGVSNLVRRSFSEHDYQTMNVVCHTFAYFSFLALPVVYYFMDKRYELYVKNLLKLTLYCGDTTTKSNNGNNNNNNSNRLTIPSIYEPSSMYTCTSELSLRPDRANGDRASTILSCDSFMIQIPEKRRLSSAASDAELVVQRDRSITTSL